MNCDTIRTSVTRYTLPSESDDDDELVEIVADENVVFSLQSLAAEPIEQELDNSRGLERGDGTDILEIKNTREVDEAETESAMVDGGQEEREDGNFRRVKSESALRCVGV